MNREEAMKQLEPFIPSLTREYLRWGEKKVDKSKDRSWLYRDEDFRKPHAEWNDPDRERYLPEVIPEHFLEGTVAEVEGEKYVAKPNDYGRNYRRVYLQVTDFAYYGNTHKYGQLQINGLRWCKEGGNSSHSWGKLSDIEPRVKGIWDVDLFRIVGEGEMAGSECPVGDSTARFVYLDELFATAAYVTLLRIQGPVVLDNASAYSVMRTKDDILLAAGADGSVEWGNKLKRVLKFDENKN